MKNLILLLLLSLTLQASAQHIDGFYKGVLHNDSARMVQEYELAIAMYKGKITGYSYVTFIANDTFYYGIRKVKGSIVGDSMVIEDAGFVANNFPESPAKGVKRTITMPLQGQDSVKHLSGNWKTNRTKKYYSVPGTIELTRSEDSLRSPLINHLKELNIIAAPVYASANATQPKKEKEKEREKEIVKVKVKDNKTKIEMVEKPVTVKPAVPAIIPYDQRQTKNIQVIEIQSDSLSIAFYDNGVVDGDSISVYANGEVLVRNAKLTTAANKISLKVRGSDELRLLLVAENMGTIPPNTGLLTIKDGDKIYQVHFSADMQTNAEITIRRK